MYRLNSEKMFYDVAEGIGVIIDFTTGYYYAFNAPGTAAFDRINAGGDPEKILSSMLETKGCPEDIEESMRGFVKKLLEKEILLESPESFADVEPFPETAFSEGKKPVVDEFADVQDLILADPIHDVDPNQGWPVLK